jgi:hypothetical protein
MRNGVSVSAGLRVEQPEVARMCIPWLGQRAETVRSVLLDRATCDHVRNTLGARRCGGSPRGRAAVGRSESAYPDPLCVRSHRSLSGHRAASRHALTGPASQHPGQQRPQPGAAAVATDRLPRPVGSQRQKPAEAGEGAPGAGSGRRPPSPSRRVPTRRQRGPPASLPSQPKPGRGTPRASLGRRRERIGIRPHRDGTGDELRAAPRGRCPDGNGPGHR